MFGLKEVQSSSGLTYHTMDVRTSTSLTAVRYRDDILYAFVRQYTGAAGPDYILMDQNARAYNPRVVKRALQSETIEQIDCPVRPLHIILIEHAGVMVQRQIFNL